MRSPDHRYSLDGGPWVPGVTSIIGMKDKSGPLVGWAKRETARCAVDNLDAVRTIRDSAGRDAAIDYLKGIPDFQRDTASDLGSRVHARLEAIATGTELLAVRDDTQPYIDTFRRDFLDRFRPTFRAVEAMVYSDLGYGGTLDAICIIDGETWIIDHKTGKSVYPEVALQLEALSSADFMGYPDDPVKYAIPRIVRYGVLHVGPEQTVLRPVYPDHDTWDTFQALLKVWQWHQTSKDIMGGAL